MIQDRYSLFPQTPNLDWKAEFRFAESRFSQLLYHGQTLMVQKLTESRFGIPKFGIPIEIRMELGSVTLKINNQQRDGMSSVRYRTRLGDLKNKVY